MTTDEPKRPRSPRAQQPKLRAVPEWDNPDDPAVMALAQTQMAAEPPAKKSVATALVELAGELYEFGVSTSGEPFAIPKGGPRVAAMLRGGKLSLRPLLAKAYFERTGRAAGAQGIADALLILEGRAHADGEQELALRVATAGDGALWVDLGDPTGRAVRIDATGWTVEAAAPMLFRRSALTGPLPVPERGGDLGELWALLNVAEDDRPLVLAWLVAALIDDIPHPVLALTGEQGTGKTTATKIIVGLVDPSPVPARKSPRDVEAWVTAAAGSWVVGIDNLSGIPPWFSDSLCRAVTGDGDVRRQLYTDGDLVVFSFRRAVVANGIDLGSLRGDLADRLLPIALDLIADTARRDEQALWPAWAAAHPRILGALLDLASGALGRLPSVELASKPRMADFARVVAAVDQVLGADGLARYLAKQGTLAADVIEGDLFASALVATVTSPWGGTSADLLKLVEPEGPGEGHRLPTEWPSNPRRATSALRRLAPVLRRAGWVVSDDGAKSKTKVLRWELTPPGENACDSSPPSPPSPPGGHRSWSQPETSAGIAAGVDRPAGIQHPPSPPPAGPTPATPQAPEQGKLLDGGDGGDGGDTKRAISHTVSCGVCHHRPVVLGSRLCLDCAAAGTLSADQLDALDPDLRARSAALNAMRTGR